MSNAEKELEARLAELDEQFERFFEWLAERYDPASGGFFYAGSSRRAGFRPDIESTAQALNIVERCGLLPELHPDIRAGLVRFFQSKQDPLTGYFLDEDPNMKEDEVMVGRAIGYSANALAKLGASPLYPLPDRGRSAPSYLESPEAYAAWLGGIELCNSWRGCDRLCNSAPYLARMDRSEREPYLRVALSFFESIQDADTGLWGEGSLYVRVSGTFKLHTFYTKFGAPMPRTREMYASILHTLRTETAIDMCYIRNPVNLLHSMKANIPPGELLEIAAITLNNIRLLKQADGGFSRELGHSPVAPNVAQVKKGEYYPNMPKPVVLGLGEAEGDMNAGTQAVLIRTLLRELARVPAVPLLRRPNPFAGAPSQ